jgi:hypothetical protein
MGRQENGVHDDRVMDVARSPVPVCYESGRPENNISDFTLVHETLPFDHSYEDASVPKTTITTPNGLQIHIDDSSSISSSHHEVDNSVVLQAQNTRSPRVRFRSRVRITSGLHHHRHKNPSLRDREVGDFVKPSTESSLSSSPSSSVSAPLRSRADDESNKPGWGPLGQRVSLLASHSQKRFSAERRGWRRRKLGLVPGDSSQNIHNSSNEHTALISSTPRPTYVQGEGVEDGQVHDSDAEDAARIAREIDLFFGKWPNRLLNHHVSIPASISFTYFSMTPISAVVVVAARTDHLLSVC